MAIKKSVFLSDYTGHWITTTTVKKSNGEEIDGPKWSESINATFEQFRFLLRQSLPDLSMEEWQTLLNVYAGSYFPAHGVPARIASDMMDNIGAVDINKVDKTYADLVRKIYDFNQTEQLAILYFIQIFWANDWPMKEWNEIVKEIKSKF
jgi:hypothetical protein